MSSTIGEHGTFDLFSATGNGATYHGVITTIDGREFVVFADIAGLVIAFHQEYPLRGNVEVVIFQDNSRMVESDPEGTTLDDILVYLNSFWAKKKCESGYCLSMMIHVKTLPVVIAAASRALLKVLYDYAS
jgi:hypothetical protein